MKCAVCGIDYGMTHNCAGPPAVVLLPPEVVEEAAPPASSFLPLHYLREAARIAVWNGVAIQRVSKDRSALPHGMAVWIDANSIPVVLMPGLYGSGHPSGLRLLVFLIPALAVSAVSLLTQVGLCFLIAKWFMGAEGRFVQILRPLLLGSIVFLLLTIPYAGVFVAAIAWICVFAMVFQVVADIEAFSAYILSIVVAIGSRVVESRLLGFIN